MCNDNLLERWLVDSCINVPNLEGSRLCADKEVVEINLVKVGWAVRVLECLLNGLASCLNVHVDYDDLLCVEARDSEHSGGARDQSWCLKFDHGVSV